MQAANDRLMRQLALGGRADASQLPLSRKELTQALQAAPPPEPLSTILDRHSRTTPPEQPLMPAPKLNPAACGDGVAADTAGGAFFGGLHGAVGSLPVGRRSAQRSRFQINANG